MSNAGEHTESLYERNMIAEIIMALSNAILLPISTIALVIIVVVYISVQNVYTLPGISMFNLTICLAIQNGLFIVIFSKSRKKLGDNLCHVVSIVAHYAALCTFFWSIMVCYRTIRAFSSASQKMLKPTRAKIIITCLMAYIPPLILVLIFIIGSQCNGCFGSGFMVRYIGTTYCWLAPGDSTLYGMTIPAGTLMFLTLLLYIWCIGVIMRNVRHLRSHALTKLSKPRTLCGSGNMTDDTTIDSITIDLENGPSISQVQNDKVSVRRTATVENNKSEDATIRRRPRAIGLFIVVNLGVMICLVWILPFINIWVRSPAITVTAQVLMCAQGLLIAVCSLFQLMNCC